LNKWPRLRMQIHIAVGAPCLDVETWYCVPLSHHHPQPHALLFLQACDDPKQIRRRRVSARTEHLVQRLDVDSRPLSQLGKPHRCVDKVAQDLASQRRASQISKVFAGPAQSPRSGRQTVAPGVSLRKAGEFSDQALAEGVRTRFPI